MWKGRRREGGRGKGEERKRKGRGLPERIFQDLLWPPACFHVNHHCESTNKYQLLLGKKGRVGSHLSVNLCLAEAVLLTKIHLGKVFGNVSFFILVIKLTLPWFTN